MAKKKPPPDGAGENGTAIADPPGMPRPQDGTREAAMGEPTAKPTPPNRPAASFAANSDQTTRIEVAVWAKVVTVSAQEEYTQYALTLSRSWQKDGNWHGNASFRIHDIPVLQYLVEQAYHWCVAQRTTVQIGDVPLPF